MILHSFVKINLLFRIMDPPKRKSPENIRVTRGRTPVDKSYSWRGFQKGEFDASAPRDFAINYKD